MILMMMMMLVSMVFGKNVHNEEDDDVDLHQEQTFDHESHITRCVPTQNGGMTNKVASTSTLKPGSPASPPWLELPEDVMAKILQKLREVEIICTTQNVCKAWRRICREPTMWRVIDMWKPDDVDLSGLLFFGVNEICRLAVDLSQGQVKEINIEDSGSDSLLEYIAERCGNLRCLRLAYCGCVSGRGLCKAVKRFPLLLELHLQCVHVQKCDIEAIGQCCPMLKTLALNGGRRVVLGCSEALAVATSMPELRHLQLFRNRMINEVLETILNGCPKLESLDLRHCFNLDLSGELGKRCAQQIKILRQPGDSTHDYEWDDWDINEYYDDEYAYVDNDIDEY